MKTVAVIDYGMGNLHSVSKALEHVAEANTRIIVTSDPGQILAADKAVLPGVGAIRDCMAEIRRHGVDEVVREVAANRPLLGICVGMQVLLDHSEENGGVECLGLLSGEVKFFGKDLRDSEGARLKVPHMGWSPVRQAEPPHPLWQGIDDNARFYFVHSYYAHVSNAAMVVGRSDYGLGFDVALGHDNIVAVQFHPEKSAANGLQLLENFLTWKP
ncbi:imidazole glycerol phosphate synthase subunit HisH [Thalassotalea sp. G20_0]|uniref:imidazole glycerol phosphate synthase subunit HisH n=1 Tax=Thalassotalea sp. G20_0 TaxID=2821093 RepID=UPI001ADC248E|nr:imidazole glycerol phosphate synthase subunit HisH [Thalassotalea sp. G20_0]MBO9495615.1 imidazole glycerol phosphate synthase subunit HisH [Thalassotalea sp. G20_0]